MNNDSTIVDRVLVITNNHRVLKEDQLLMGEGKWEVQLYNYGMNKSWGKKIQQWEYSQWYCKSYMATDGSYTCGKDSITYRVVQALCCMLKLK